MDRDKAIKTLNNSGASKNDLREALSFALGVEPEKGKKPASVFSECQDIWMNAYREHTGVGYYFAAKDAGALKSLIGKIEHLNESDESDLIKATFEALVKSLPVWYRNNAFSLAIVNSKFNEITAEIRKNNGKANKADNGISDSFRAQLFGGLPS